MSAPDKETVLVEFHTETLLDTRAFMTFGLNAKPNTDSPIGSFGTGLKYAIAILVREEIPITIWAGKSSFEFYGKPSKFRDVEVTDIKYKKRQLQKNGKMKVVSHGRLPFTTDLGKTWELWQVFRELHSNTLDEGGSTSLVDTTLGAFSGSSVTQAAQTGIQVGGSRFAQVYHNRNEIFLENASQLTTHTNEAGESVALPDIEIFAEPSQYIYYRGIRVLDLNAGNYEPDAEENPVKAKHTYNFIGHTELTEDRTMAYPYAIMHRIGIFVMRMENIDIIKQILETSSKKYWEGKIDFGNAHVIPSKEFLEAFRTADAPLPAAISFMYDYTKPKAEKRKKRTPDEIIAGLRKLRIQCTEDESTSVLNDAINFILKHLATEVLF